MAMVATAPESTRSPIETEVQRIRALLQERRYEESLQAARTLGERVPENRDVLYLIAVSERFLNRAPASLETLARLEQHHPRFSRLFQERGYCYVALRDAPRAIEAFLRGVNINPALPASWSMLEGLYRMVGDKTNAETAAAHVATLKRLPAEVVHATALFSDGELALAESAIRAFLIRHGDHVEAMRLLARIGMQREVLDDAEVLLAALLELAPDYRAARNDYVTVLLERHKYLKAREEAEKLMKLEPENRDYRALYANACVGLGEHARALPIYRELAAGTPRAADLHLSVAHCLKTLGRTDEAVAAYRESATVRPSFGEAYWSLANLKTYRFTDAEVARMRTEEATSTTLLADRYHLCFALGKALEDRGEYPQAFGYYERGNALKKSESRYRPEVIERNTHLQKQVCTREFFHARAQVGDLSDAPIFIVGLPRSGSTLIEQILASHSCVEGTQELAEIPRMVLELQGRDAQINDPRYPGVLADLKAADFARLGEKYLADTRIYRTDKPRFIDKMPNNFRHVGLIHLILPNARIIDARREPMACCFSNFKQLFANGQEFTYSIEDIARYYRTYLELMRHWDDALPGRVLRVSYEDVVEHLERNVRRILDFCGLEFERACLDFHKTERSVRTASSEQVRQPIFRQGLEQWRHFEPWLGGLREALGDALERYRP
jgi:tetratricopeptide (TPR) repeat protein